MFMNITCLTFLSIFSLGSAIFRTCVPNTHFLLNGRLCYCDNAGQWTESACHTVSRRQACTPGQIVWEDCSQCICQDNGLLQCTNSECGDEHFRKNQTVEGHSTSELWCTPFMSYYINCSLCVCPASGKMSQAKCATDSSCSLNDQYISLDLINKTLCIPKVMYLFKCLHCLCADNGYFIKSKCVETCQTVVGSSRRCIPKTFYRIDCNVYRCPENGMPDNRVCSKSKCMNHPDFNTLAFFRQRSLACVPHTFTKRKCIYCECSQQGVLDDKSCLEQDCLKVRNFTYDSVKSVCSPGEMVPICMECFCPKTGMTEEKHCTRVCSLQNKLIMLENILKDKENVVDRILLKETSGTDMCDPNSVFLDQGRYCLCPESGNTNYKACTSVVEDDMPRKLEKVIVDKGNMRNFNVTCKPHTFIEIGCNTCFCTKNGTADPKWCTFDDCEAKQLIQSNQRHRNPAISESDSCVPGSISKVDCNFCICSSTGLLKDRACTTNDCSTITNKTNSDFIVCDPSSYYSVDCNICFCPIDGIKNVEKCTKNQCEKNFLRSDVCTPGELFSEDCNICICPPSGKRLKKACTNRTCLESDTPWKKIFKLSQNLFDNHMMSDETKDMELCFPGEEFEEDCKTCICPEMGLREYASCIPMKCDDIVPKHSTLHFVNQMASSDEADQVDNFNTDDDLDEKNNMFIPGIEDRHKPKSLRKQCSDFTYDPKDGQRPCNPGSEYIIGCRVCVCPYSGDVARFCRQLENTRYCEEIYASVVVEPQEPEAPERRTDALTNVTKKGSVIIHDNHSHTAYRCTKLGSMRDKCHLCKCEEGFIMYKEHCFKNQDVACNNVTNKFLVPENKLVE